MLNQDQAIHPPALLEPESQNGTTISGRFLKIIGKTIPRYIYTRRGYNLYRAPTKVHVTHDVLASDRISSAKAFVDALTTVLENGLVVLVIPLARIARQILVYVFK
jgi:hypothetical protein